MRGREVKEMDPRTFTISQWIAVGMFITVSLATAGFWQDLVSPKIAISVSGGLMWFGSILQFLLTGKMPEPKAPVA
jgi:hypothetical protein